jgi:hypothetical protein
VSERHFSSGRIRTSMLAFAIGKAISAPLSIALILMLAAVMSRAEYASYIASVAVLEIGVVFGTLGIEWLIQTCIPAILVRGNASQLRHAVLLFAVLPGVPYVLIAGCVWQFAHELSAMLGGVASVEVLRLYAVVMAIEGPTRTLRDQLMAALMLQRNVQVSQIVRVLAVFVMVGIAVLSGTPLQAADVARAEILAASLALLVALAGLVAYLVRMWPTRRMTDALGEWLGWHSVRFAGHAYGSLLLMLLLGTEMMTTLVARYLGADATAAFGFVVRLVETARRYLPMDIFYGVLRPAAIGRFEAAERRLDVLLRDCNRMVEANLLVIGAGMAVALAVGDLLVAFLSKGSVVPPPLLLAALLPVLVCHSVRRVVELVAYATGQSAVFLRAAFASLLAPLLGALMLRTLGLVQLAPLAVIVADTLFIVLAMVGLARRGLHVRMNVDRWARMVVAVAIGAAAGGVVRRAIDGAPGMWMAVAVAAIVYFGGVFALRVIDADDRRWAASLLRSRASA